MTNNSPVLIQLLDNHMRYMAQRQAVLAQNISNLDTPAHKAQDLKKQDFSKLTDHMSGKLPMMATTGNHLAPLNSNGYAVNKQRDSFEKTPVGNEVSLEEQMAKVSDTGIQYSMSSALIKKYTKMQHTVLGN
jgi:flagellar basal-body rod protein FlgB